MSSQFSRFVFYFYQIEIGVPVVMLGVAFTIFAIWNMINDPLLGYLTDRPFKFTKKWGMRFPWILIGGLPLCFIWILLFTVPEGFINQVDTLPVFIYFIVITCIFDTFHSLYIIHINAGFTNHFRTEFERNKSSFINNTIPGILQLFMGFIVPTFYIYGNISSMIFAQILLGFSMLACMLILIPGIRESEDLKQRFLRGYEQVERDSYLKTMKAAFKRKNFVATLIVFILLTLGNAVYLASIVYFYRDVLAIPYSNAVIPQLLMFLGNVVFIPVWFIVMKKIGTGNMMKLSCVLITISYLPNLWVASLGEIMISSFFGGIATGAFYITLGPVSADVYDESTIDTGKHQEAMYEGIRAFFLRFGIIFQGVILTVIFVITGYDSSDPLAIQTPLAIWGIRTLMGLIPSILAFFSFVVMTIWYDLIGEKQKMLKHKLKEMGL